MFISHHGRYKLFNVKRKVLTTLQNAKKKACGVLAVWFCFKLCLGMKMFVTPLKTGTQFA